MRRAPFASVAVFRVRGGFWDQKSEIKKGMVFAVECWKGAEDGSGAARIEEEVVVTDDGCEIITNFPSDHLISCGLPGCEFY